VTPTTGREFAVVSLAAEQDSPVRWVARADAVAAVERKANASSPRSKATERCPTTLPTTQPDNRPMPERPVAQASRNPREGRGQLLPDTALASPTATLSARTESPLPPRRAPAGAGASSRHASTALRTVSARQPGMHHELVLIDQSQLRQRRCELHTSHEQSFARLPLELLNGRPQISAYEFRVPVDPAPRCSTRRTSWPR
jgi:hypothetical protein